MRRRQMRRNPDCRRKVSERMSTGKKEATATQVELDIIVVHMELTLIAIIQGVALTFLVDRSYDVLVSLRFTFWPYVLTGLLTILIFWSRSLVHTLTVIRWPLDFTHNFMYIACTLAEAVAFTQLSNPLYWYALTALFALTVWALFVLDLRMIRRRIGDSSGPTGSRLYALKAWPAALIQRGGHVIIALVQLAAAVAYLLYGISFSSRVIPSIAKTRQEWSEEVLP